VSQIETTFKDDIKWEGEKAFVYKLFNEETKEFYYGSKDMKNQSWSDFVETSNYVTSSTIESCYLTRKSKKRNN
jgi:hypothetical protein